MKYPHIYTTLAEMISYPKQDYAVCATECERLLNVHFPEIAPCMIDFIKFATSSERSLIEETYTATFEVNGVCHLDVGYQLFGEDYKRGALLVELSRVQREAGCDVGTELADHLPSLLRLLPRMVNSDERTELVRRLILPAIEKMISSFPQQNENPYRLALSVTASVLESDFGSRIEFPTDHDYLAKIEEVMHV